MKLSESVPADVGSENAYTYFAFISYKSADEKWARWLKHNLQRYRLPARTHRKHPQLDRRCSPVFLDKTHLTPGLLDSGLADEVQSARFLIVICSRAARENSRYLDDELRYFLEGSGDLSRVIPFIVDESRNPVEECFPAYLAQLCRERDIAGVSVHDDGRRSALLRLIAAMLGIKREELESDDLRRRRRQHLFAAALALVFLVGGGFCWDYFRLKTAYYTDYAEVYGVPTGIGRLSGSEWKGMSAHFALVSSRGRVRELRCENAAGRLVPDDRESRLDPVSKAEYEYAGERLSSVRLYDENGHLTAEMHYVNQNTVDLVRNPAGDVGTAFSAAAPLPSHSTPMDTGEQDYKSNIIRYLFFYDDAGFSREVHYASDAYNRFAEDADGIAGIRYDRDELGRVTRLFYLTFISDESTDAGRPEHYQVIGKRSGEAGIAFAYDSDDNCTERQVLDARGQVMTDPAYGALTRYEYAGHNEIRMSCFDEKGDLFLNDRGWAVKLSQYDERGRRVRVSFCGLNGEPVLCSEGYAVEETLFDEQGNPLRISFFGLDGEPILNADGYAGYVSAFDGQGRQTGAAYFGTEGEPVLSTFGYAGWNAVYDERGNLVRVAYYGTDGEAVLSAEGYAGWESVFDELGNEIRIAYYGPSGEAVCNVDGYAGWESVFDERGNERKVSFFGADGRPTLEKHGIAGYEAVYDERGNRTAVSYFGTEGEPLLSTFGYAGFERVYDELGNLVRCRFLGTDGEPVPERHGIAGWDAVFDLRGREIKRSYFGADGAPALYGGDRYAGILHAYDERGNEIRRSFFGPDGSPVLTENGYCGWESVFDERGNEIRCRFFGLDGESVLHVGGYAGWEAVFDLNGREIRRSYFGLDGEALPSADGAAA